VKAVPLAAGPLLLTNLEKFVALLEREPWLLYIGCAGPIATALAIRSNQERGDNR